MPDECLTFGIPRLRGLAPPEGGTPNKYQLRYPTAAGFRSEFRVYALFSYYIALGIAMVVLGAISMFISTRLRTPGQQLKPA